MKELPEIKPMIPEEKEHPIDWPYEEENPEAIKNCPDYVDWEKKRKKAIMAEEAKRIMEEKQPKYRWKKEDQEKINKRVKGLLKKKQQVKDRGEITEPHKFWKVRLKRTDRYLTPNGFSFQKGGAMVITTKKQLLRVMADLHNFSATGKIPEYRKIATGRNWVKLVPKNIGDMEIVEFGPSASIDANSYFAPEFVEKWHWRVSENEKKNKSE